MMTAASKNKNVSKPTTPTATPAPVVEQPKAPVATEAPVAPAVALAAETKPATPSKAQMTLMRLSVELAKRNVTVTPEMLKMDGNYLILNIGETWPAIRIGKGGGIDLPQIRSYPKAFEAALEGDKLLAKQNERAAKQVATPVTAKIAAQVQPEVKTEVGPETPAQRKAKEDAALEAKLDAAADDKHQAA